MQGNIYTHQSSNVLKTYLLMGFFLAFIVFIGFFISEAYGAPEILYIAIILSVVMNIGSYWFSDKIALAVSGAHEAKKDVYYDLYTVTENLSIAAGLPMPKLYVIEEQVPNAFATGRNKNHAAIAVTTGLLNTLERRELEGVIAHELSHIGNRDILLMSVVVVLVGLLSIVSDMVLRSMWFGKRDNNDRGGIGGIVAILGIVAIVLSPLIASLIKLAISRRREYLADASGALLTRFPEGLASALEKISSYPGSVRRATTATAHMYISNPFGKGTGQAFANLFATHPPAAERIRRLREMS